MCRITTLRVIFPLCRARARNRFFTAIGDTVWTQQGHIAGVGGYWQQGEDVGAIVQVGYGQRPSNGTTPDGGVMLVWDKRPYDGKQT